MVGPRAKLGLRAKLSKCTCNSAMGYCAKQAVEWVCGAVLVGAPVGRCLVHIHRMGTFAAIPDSASTVDLATNCLEVIEEFVPIVSQHCTDFQLSVQWTHTMGRAEHLKFNIKVCVTESTFM